MEMSQEVEKEKVSLKSRVKTGLRRVSTRLSHPRRTASAVYPESMSSDSSDDALHIAHPRRPTTSTSSQRRLRRPAGSANQGPRNTGPKGYQSPTARRELGQAPLPHTAISCFEPLFYAGLRREAAAYP